MKAFIGCLLMVACANAGYVQHGHASSYASVVRHDEPSKHGQYDNHLHYDHGYHAEGHNDYSSHPQYEYKYGVKDLKTGDIKDAWESRDGDVVKGSYTLKEADGTTRVVDYTSDKHNGFNAVVKNMGHAYGPSENVYKHEQLPVHKSYDKEYYWKY